MAEPIPLIKMQTSSRGPGRGQWAKILLQPDGSVTWEPCDPPERKRKPSWWQRVTGRG